MKNIFLLFIFIFSFSSCTKKNNDVDLKGNINHTWKYLVAIDSIAKINNNQRSTGSEGGIATRNYLVDFFKTNNIKVEAQNFLTKEGKNAANVIAEIPGKSSNIILIGAHYDSVEFGPGINDNATGVAILLALAKQIEESKLKPNYTIQFAFWDGEEIGLQGSNYYVNEFKKGNLDKIKYYINVDMVGTTNSQILLLDGDNSSFEYFTDKLSASGLSKEDINAFRDELIASSPQQVTGAKELEDILSNYFKENKIKFNDDYITSLSTDVYPFIGKVPTTGLAFINEIEVESENENETTILYAPCYHQNCDGLDNVNKESLKVANDAIFYLIKKLAY